MSISCPFCNPDPDRVFLVRPRLLGIWDAYPVTAGHALILPTRHIPDLASATAEERQGLWDLIDPVMTVIAKRHGPIDGFNIGINGGEAAGQTVPHLHMHVIPRRRGDVADPRGGVRYVIPERANYLASKPAIAPRSAPAGGSGTSAVGGESLLELVTGQAPSEHPEQLLVFDSEARKATESRTGGPASPQSEPSPDDQVRFLTRLERLLDGGSFSATYKYALLLALADLAVEQGRDDSGELSLSTDAIAEKFIECYWEQCRPFAEPAAAPEAAEPGLVPAASKEAKPKLEKVLSLLVPVYSRLGGELAALRADGDAWAKLLKSVRAVVQGTPLWKLQTVADTENDFLYPSVGRGAQITLRPGIAFCLRRFHGLVGGLVRGAWGDRARSQSSGILGDAADLQEFFFGPRQLRLRSLRPAFYEMQKGRCFYSGKEIARPEQGEIDPFIPFSRYALDLGHNLVLASKRAKADKSDHLAAEDHLSAWHERNAQLGAALADACAGAGIVSDLERSCAVTRWAYELADRMETPVWKQGATLERGLSGRWREILGSGATAPE